MQIVGPLVGILANHLGTEIAAVDVQTNNVYTYAPETAPATNRIYIIYDGILRFIR